MQAKQFNIEVELLNEGVVMKKILTLLAAVIPLFLFGCASTQVVPADIQYKEIKGEDYLDEYLDKLIEQSKAYKIIDVYISKIDDIKQLIENPKSDFYMEIAESPNGFRGRRVLANEYAKKMNELDPTWAERLESVKNDKRYNGQYTVYLYFKEVGNFMLGTETIGVIYDMEGIPTLEKIAADDLAEKKAKEEKQLADEKAKAQADAENNAKGKAIAKGYTYHGIEEAEQNSVLFQGGALEKGHAYYIKGFTPAKYSPATVAVIMTLFGESNPVLVSYKDQKVKADVMNASSLWGEYLPVTVIVTADTVLPNRAVVLGIVE